MSRSLSSTLALLTLGIISCRGGAPSGDRDDHRAGAPTSPRPASVASAATQRDLAAELDATEHTADPIGAMVALQQRWQGRHLTWTVTRQEVLCRTAGACHVVPFPAPRPADVSSHGWLPALEFAPGQFDKLTAACGDASICEVTFAGDLTELAVSDDLPTSLRFTDVTVVTATAAIAIPRHPGG